MTHILLVEDDRSLGATLHERLRKEGYEVFWAKSKAEALLARENFNLFIFDVGLPDGTGFELARELLRQGTHTPFLFLTAQSDAESRLTGYDLGAEEYIPKPFHLRELLLRVKHVLDNHAPSPTLQLGNLHIDFASFQVKRGGEGEAVAPKDLMFLKLLIEAAPKVVRRDEALDLLWGEDKFPSTRTVDNSVLRLRTLLGPEAGRIESVRGVGYRWKENADE